LQGHDSLHPKKEKKDTQNLRTFAAAKMAGLFVYKL
jgi:hypothetical protein